MNPETVLNHLLLLRADDFVRVGTLRECVKLLCSEPDKPKQPESQAIPDGIEVGDEVRTPAGSSATVLFVKGDLVLLHYQFNFPVTTIPKRNLILVARPPLQLGDFVRIKATGTTGLLGRIHQAALPCEIWHLGSLCGSSYTWCKRDELELLSRP